MTDAQNLRPTFRNRRHDDIAICLCTKTLLKEIWVMKSILRNLFDESNEQMVGTSFFAKNVLSCWLIFWDSNVINERSCKHHFKEFDLNAFNNYSAFTSTL